MNELRLNLLVLTQEEKEVLLDLLDSRKIDKRVYDNLINRFINTSLPESTISKDSISSSIIDNDSDKVACFLKEDNLIEKFIDDLLTRTQHKLLKEKILMNTFFKVLQESPDLALEYYKINLIRELERLPIDLQNINIIVNHPSYSNCEVKYFYKDNPITLNKEIKKYLDIGVRLFSSIYHKHFNSIKSESDYNILQIYMKFTKNKNLELSLTIREHNTTYINDFI